MIDIDAPTTYMKYELTETSVVLKTDCDNTCATCSSTSQMYPPNSWFNDRIWSCYESLN